MEKLYFKSNLGDKLELSRRPREVFGYYNLIYEPKFTNPMRSGKETKYLRLLRYVRSNPGTTYTNIVKSICSCTPVFYNGKFIPNNDMIPDTLTYLKDYGILKSSYKDGYTLTEVGEEYLKLIEKPGFKRFKAYIDFGLGPLNIHVTKSSCTKRGDVIEVTESTGKDYYGFTSIDEFLEFLKTNNYKITIIHEV